MTSTNNYDIDEIYSTIASLATANPGLQMGDVNADGTINILDAVMTVQAVLNNIDLTEEQFSIIDLNQDGALNVLDVVSLINLILIF